MGITTDKVMVVLEALGYSGNKIIAANYFSVNDGYAAERVCFFC
jgi:hypothetical protein